MTVFSNTHNLQLAWQNNFSSICPETDGTILVGAKKDAQSQLRSLSPSNSLYQGDVYVKIGALEHSILKWSALGGSA